MSKAIANVAILACLPVLLACQPNPDSVARDAYVETVPIEQASMVDRYVSCVNSRFPLRANRYAKVTTERVAIVLKEGNLDMAGMETTYENLGCGELKEEKGGDGE